MKKISIILLTVLFILINQTLFPCTGFVTVNGKKILFGNNEDRGSKFDTAVWFHPPSAVTFGYISVGFSSETWVQGGMNDQGLCLDSFSIPENNWTEDPDKMNFSGPITRHILETCATVEDVITFCSERNLNYFSRSHLFVVDKTGNAAIIEWGDKDIEAILKQGDFQVITNFFILHPQRGNYPCWRYDTAADMLSESTDFSWELCRSILDAVQNGTSYSNIYELHQGTMTIFNQHNFDEFITFNITEELAKGRHIYSLPEVMSKIKLLRPENEQVIDPTSVEFSWTGKTASTYLLYYSTDPDFSDCTPIEINGEYSSTFYQSSSTFLLLLVIPLGFTFKPKHIRFMGAIVLILITVLSTSCSTTSDYQPEFKQFFITVENLQPDSTYYWKITANATETLASKSIVGSFKTF